MGFFDAIADIVGGAGNWLSDIVGGVGGAASDLGGAAWQGLSSNPWGVLGTGLQTGDTLMRMMMMNGQGGGGDQGGMSMQGLQSQMGQPAGPTPEMMRRRLADSQAAGMSGASPDFLATLAGVTPDELTKLMGYQYGGGGQS